MISSFYGYSGISDSLAGIFEALSDQEGMNGRRYRQADVWTLLKDVAERRFATGVYELCHLLRGFGQLERRGEAVNIFWMADPATPNGFKGILNAYCASPKLSEQLAIDGNILKLVYPCKKEFEIKTGRMPYLAALFDFMVNAIGYVDLQDSLKKLCEADLTHRALSDVSNDLFSKAYAYLNDHLPSSQGQRKMRHILTFLNQYHGEGFSLSDIDDETIIAFWENQEFGENGEGSSDFIRFATVFDDFTRYAQAQRDVLSKRDVADARVIGIDVEAGEVDPGQLANENLSWVEAGEDLLERLSEPPLDEVKFLGKKEIDLLQDILDRPTEISDWALSYLRANTFGQGQSRITQALRNKTDATSFQNLCEDSSKSTYEDQCSKAAKLSENIKNTHLASLYVATTLSAKEKTSDTVELDFQMLGKARKAFHNISRQGFQDTVLDDPENAPLFERGADCLDVIDNRYSRIVKAIQQVDAVICYSEDKPRFAERFHKIYGGHG